MGSKCPFCRDGENALSEGIPVTQPLGIPHGIGRDRRVVTAAEKKSFKQHVSLLLTFSLRY